MAIKEHNFRPKARGILLQYGQVIRRKDDNQTKNNTKWCCGRNKKVQYFWGWKTVLMAIVLIIFFVQEHQQLTSYMLIKLLQNMLDSWFLMLLMVRINWARWACINRSTSGEQVFTTYARIYLSNLSQEHEHQSFFSSPTVLWFWRGSQFF